MTKGAQKAPQTPTHAGAVVVRPARAGPEYLIVRARSERPEWVFPKGHIEPGETPEAAALRETREEAGVAGAILAPLGSTSFASRSGPATVVYFLVDCRGAAPTGEGRERLWCSYDAAHRHLSFPDSRRVLAAAARLSQRLRPARSGVDEDHGNLH